jgi:hypothetical protein
MKITGVLTDEGKEDRSISMRCMHYREVAIVDSGSRKGEIVLCVQEVYPIMVISLSSETKWTITNDFDQTVEGLDIPRVKPYKGSTLLLRLE